MYLGGMYMSRAQPPVVLLLVPRCYPQGSEPASEGNESLGTGQEMYYKWKFG